MKQIFYSIGIFCFFTVSFSPYVFGEKLDVQGIISEIIVPDDDIIYYFEQDELINSPTWIPDTNVMINYEGVTKKVSDSLFIFPTELTEFEDSLFFASLSHSCIEFVQCDYQDIFKMSKKDGSYEKIFENLKSAIHIAVEDEFLYVTESSGRIWKIDHDGSKPSIIYEGNNLIMDVTSNGDTVYWIEEIADRRSHIMKKELDIPAIIIQEELQIPYGLEFFEDSLYWYDLRMELISGDMSEFTQISKYHDKVVTHIQKFENTSPVTIKKSVAHHKPYLAYGDFIILSNNTDNESKIQLIDTRQKLTYDIGEIENYVPSYFKAHTNTLYIMGHNDDEFIIEKIALPIPIPEFSDYMLGFVTISSFSLILLLSQKFPLSSKLKI